MKVFIWEYVEEATGHYHSTGGVVVIAETEDRAYELAKEQGVKFKETEVPTLSLDLLHVNEERVFVFPDAGCC